MREVVQGFVSTMAVLAWLAGAVLAKGSWATAAAVILPPYGWYLVVERAMHAMGVV